REGTLGGAEHRRLVRGRLGAVSRGGEVSPLDHVDEQPPADVAEELRLLERARSPLAQLTVGGKLLRVVGHGLMPPGQRLESALSSPSINRGSLSYSSLTKEARGANLRFVPVAGLAETSLAGWTRRPDQDVGALPAVLAQVAQPVLAHLGELDLVAVGVDDRRDERGRAERSDGIAKPHAAPFQVLGEGAQIEDPESQAHRTGRRRPVARM